MLYIGKVSERDAEGVQRRVESMLAARILGNAIDRDDARWLSESPTIREKLERLDLIPSGKIQIDRRCMSMEEFLCGRGSTVPCRSQHGDGVEERQPTN